MTNTAAENRDLERRQALTAKARQMGWQPPSKSSDYLTWVTQKYLGVSADGLLGPNTESALLAFTSKKHNEIRRKILRAVADTLEGLGVGEIAAIATFDAADAQAVKAAFSALVHELRARSLW